MTERGKFIVIEGTDGSGKGTQVEALSQYLISNGYRTRVIDFPRYNDNPYGELTAQYLKGQFGRDVHPRVASLIYAGDRRLAKPKIEEWLDQGCTVISNRYQPSNLAFQSARLPALERESFIEWLEDLEYGADKIPREDLVLLMNVSPEVSYSMVSGKGLRDYLGGEKRDLLEENLDYQKVVAEMYLWLADHRSHWRVINCMQTNGNIRGRSEITGLMIDVFKNEGIIK